MFAAFGPGRVFAALRPRAAPAPAADARRRRAGDPDGLQPRFLAAGHAGAVLRRGDRDGREPRDRGALQRPLADAVVRRGERRILDRRRGRAAVPAGGGRRALWARRGQRRTPAAGGRFAAELVRAPHQAQARVPGDRFRHARGARRRCRLGPGPPLRLGRVDARGRARAGRRVGDGDDRARPAGGRRRTRRPVLRRGPPLERAAPSSSSSPTSPVAAGPPPGPTTPALTKFHDHAFVGRELERCKVDLRSGRGSRQR